MAHSSCDDIVDDIFFSVLLNFLYRINSKNSKFFDPNEKNENERKMLECFIFYF